MKNSSVIKLKLNKKKWELIFNFFSKQPLKAFQFMALKTIMYLQYWQYLIHLKSEQLKKNQETSCHLSKGNIRKWKETNLFYFSEKNAKTNKSLKSFLYFFLYKFAFSKKKKKKKKNNHSNLFATAQQNMSTIIATFLKAT